MPIIYDYDEKPIKVLKRNEKLYILKEGYCVDINYNYNNIPNIKYYICKVLSTYSYLGIKARNSTPVKLFKLDKKYRQITLRLMHFLDTFDKGVYLNLEEAGLDRNTLFEEETIKIFNFLYKKYVNNSGILKIN